MYRRIIAKYFRYSALSLFAVAFAFSGCLPKSGNNNPTGAIQQFTRADSIARFYTRRAYALQSYLMQLDWQTEGLNNRDSEKIYWRAARNQYEQIRWAVEELAQDSLNQHIAPWFSTNTDYPYPRQGFHYIEVKLWGSGGDSTGLHSAAEGMLYSVLILPGLCNNGILTDSVVFNGLEYMLADIDSLKFSGLDASYSNNSYNDGFSNFDGLDSVYRYYQDSVKNYSPTIDSTFTARLAAAQSVLQSAGSLATLDKQSYRTNELYPLEDAVKQVASVFGVTIQ